MMRVLAVVPYPPGRAPGQRYRIEQWAPYLRDEGIDVTFAPFLTGHGMDVVYRPGHVGVKVRETLRGYAARLAHARRARAADVVFLYREAAPFGPPWIERLLARRPVVFDFDDAIYIPDTSPANAWSLAFKPRGRAAAICRLARHVTVGNEFLADFARRAGARVTVVPSTIDTTVYRVVPRPANARPIVGWTGSVTTLPNLLEIGPALRRLAARVDFELRVIGVQVEIPGVAVSCVPWNAATEPDDLRALDIGVMPLPDTEWSRGKCGMKALQYMALGIAPVVAPVGVNADIVRDGVNGFHARTDDDWIERIARLVRDEALRRKLGDEARETIEARYSARVQVPRVAAVLRAAAR